jgi:4-hydroxythreonine-4-phosphate dehydrogenase
MGDPLGIGPEIILKALANPDLPTDARIVVVGSRAVLQQAADALGLDLDLPPARLDGRPAVAASLLDLDNFPADALEPRQPCAAAGKASIQYIEMAVRMARKRTADAVVTCPISKEAIAAAGSPFAGHTEMLAHLTESDGPVMLLISDRLRVALVTTHLALRDVPGAVTAPRIVRTTQVLADGLRRLFGVSHPRIAVCGLNPHCSDGGRFGDEERTVIGPAVSSMQESGLDVCGPRPSDTVFEQAVRGTHDAVVALYHDQALIPVKMGGLHGVVNVTLGLPIIRTSVGHGTAYDIAGLGRADERSLVQAVRVATKMVRARDASDKSEDDGAAALC